MNLLGSFKDNGMVVVFIYVCVFGVICVVCVLIGNMSVLLVLYCVVIWLMKVIIFVGFGKILLGKFF